MKRDTRPRQQTLKKGMRIHVILVIIQCLGHWCLSHTFMSSPSLSLRHVAITTPETGVWPCACLTAHGQSLESHGHVELHDHLIPFNALGPSIVSRRLQRAEWGVTLKFNNSIICISFNLGKCPAPKHNSDMLHICSLCRSKSHHVVMKSCWSLWLCYNSL